MVKQFDLLVSEINDQSGFIVDLEFLLLEHLVFLDLDFV